MSGFEGSKLNASLKLDDPLYLQSLRRNPAKVGRRRSYVWRGKLGAVCQIDGVHSKLESDAFPNSEIPLNIPAPYVLAVRTNAVDAKWENAAMESGWLPGCGSFEVRSVKPTIESLFSGVEIALEVVQVATIKKIWELQKRAGLKFIDSAYLPTTQNMIENSGLKEATAFAKWKIEYAAAGQPVWPSGVGGRPFAGKRKLIEYLIPGVGLQPCVADVHCKPS